MPKKLFLIIIISFFFCIFPDKIYAESFSFDYDVTYEIRETGQTEVIYQVIITNNQTEYYAKNFSLSVASEKLYNIRVTDIFGEINPQINKGDGRTTITFDFNKPVVGIDKKLPFSIKFISDDIAVKKGRIWEILIPGIEIDSQTNDYKIRLIVPKSFGKLAYVTPASQTFGIWSRKEHQGKGISLAYGDFQAYDLRLKYFLKNDFNERRLFEITLPPDTTYQKIILKRLSEIPSNIITDTDGNYLAQYILEPNKSKEIEAELQAQVFISSRSEYKKKLNPKEINVYTANSGYWEINNINKSDLNTNNLPKSIYEYVVNNLNYDYSQINQNKTRITANEIIENKNSAVCLEFSDLFVSLMRQNKIPTMAVHGYAYTTNSRIQPLSLTADILHAWNQYYDESSGYWKPVDPTWGKTTLGIDYFSNFDFNHIAFSLLGSKSDYPLPAGGYRNQNNEKTVYVDFADELYKELNKIDSTAILKNLYSGTKSVTYIKIENKGNTAREIRNLQIETDNLSISSDLNIIIPPLGNIKYPFDINPKISINKRKQELVWKIDGISFSKQIDVLPFYMQNQIIIGFMIFLGGLSIYVFRRFYK